MTLADFCRTAALLLAAEGAPPPAAAARNASGLLPRSSRSAPLLGDVGGPPLQTKGRYVVSSRGTRIKLACVNWYGAYSKKHVVGGLEEAPMDEIVQLIWELGFNCVRLTYCTDAHVRNPVILEDAVSANREFVGKTFLDVWDATIEAITSTGLMVIINNHNHECGWCCHFSQDEGLWYKPGYPESLWIESLVNMTERYRNNSMVVAIDLRNEVHDYKDTLLTWGDGNEKTDWGAAATRAGNAVLRANPDVLVVVMALCFGMDLRGAQSAPVKLSVPNRVVYQAHNYLEYQWWELVSQSFVSWESIQAFCAAAWVLCLVVAWQLARGWQRLSMPCPSCNTWLVVAGSWWFALCAASALGSTGFYVLASVYCSYWAKRDILPAIVLSCILASFGLAMACWGCLLGRTRSVEPVGEPVATAQPSALRSSASEPSTLGRQQPEAMAAVVPEEQAALADPEEAPPDEKSTASGRRLERRGLCKPGWSSCRVACARLTRPAREFRGQPRPKWDCGLCCGLQCFILCASLVVILAGLFIWACMAPSYWLTSSHLDNMWGFALQEGYDYTAPVLMGEFGNAVRGRYWLHLMRYLAARDIDYAYWAINGRKWAEGYIDITSGTWIQYDQPRWEPETYGILNDDYRSVRSPWRLMDLQDLASSSQRWGEIRPCDRGALGAQCGG